MKAIVDVLAVCASAGALAFLLGMLWLAVWSAVLSARAGAPLRQVIRVSLVGAAILPAALADVALFAVGSRSAGALSTWLIDRIGCTCDTCLAARHGWPLRAGRGR